MLPGPPVMRLPGSHTAGSWLLPDDFELLVGIVEADQPPRFVHAQQRVREADKLELEIADVAYARGRRDVVLAQQGQSSRYVGADGRKIGLEDLPAPFLRIV